MFSIGAAMYHAQSHALDAATYEVKIAQRHSVNEEQDLRKNNPAVKDAWEQYQIVLKLARSYNNG